MQAFFIKTPNNLLMPASYHDQELLKKIKVGAPVRMKLTQIRNYEFHKKYFALLNLAYDYWEVPQPSSTDLLLTKNVPPPAVTPEKNFDRFRKDIIILAGFYEASYRLNGEVRLEAKSISFHSMSEDEFEELYTKTIDVIIKHVLKNYTDEMLRSVLDQIEAFE